MLLRAAGGGVLSPGKPFTLAGEGGSSSFVTVDFARPVHGYPHVVLQGAPAGWTVGVLDAGVLSVGC